MIKINLANSILKKSEKEAAALGSSKAAQTRDTVIKILLIVLPVIGFRLYEGHELEQKQAHLHELIQQKDKMAQELSKLGSVDEIIKQVDEQKKELAEKFSVLKQIFGLRRQKIQALALLQKHIPPSCWLEEVNVLEDNSLTNGKIRTLIKVIGFGTSVEDIQTFASLLNLEKAVFDKVRPPEISAEVAGKEGTKKFTMDMFLKE
ncbi:MAG: hypothetical protein H6623_05050 [Bdellovibrionaceae bacterium]|nr:hypothetical protein [Pseudobdellovibrionaceae bacterium]